MKSYAIIGLGLFGIQLAKELYSAGGNVLAIDQNEKLTDQIADHVTQAACLDAKDRDALSQLSINKYDCVIVAMSGDLATSVLITMNLKALNVPNIICKVQKDTDKEVLEALGATSCIIPEHIGATKLSKQITGRNVLDFTQLSDDHSIIEISTPACWIGKNLVELHIRSKYHVNIIGIRNNNRIHVDLNPAEILSEQDKLIIIGNNDHLNRLQKFK